MSALRRGMLAVAAAATLGIAAAGGAADSRPGAQEIAEARVALEAMRARDQQLLDIGWRLATANAPYCENAAPDAGWLLLDTGSFPDPQTIESALGVETNIIVQAVASDSPAHAAGLSPLAQIWAVDGEVTHLPAAARPVTGREGDWQLLSRLYERADTSLARNGSLAITHSNGAGARETATIKGMPACAIRMEQRDGEDKARADGKRILIGSRFPGFAWPEDEFAAAIAHEMAHIALGHSRWLDGAGRTRANIRMTEEEADRLAPWLLANAGYDPFAAERFMRRWGPEYAGGFLTRKRSHARWQDRATWIAQEAELAKAALTETSAADWRARFARSAPNDRD